MRCIHCGGDSDYRARQGSGACRWCQRPFAFEPKRDQNMTDRTFKLALEGVSDRGALLWNDDQLYYDLCRRVRRRRLFDRLIRQRTVSLDRPEFELLYARWIDVHGAPEGRLHGRQFEPHADGLPANPDAFGFERLVVCESEAIADVLLANGFHAEAKTPVLAFGGYPPHVYDALVPRLRESPPALVVAVHDASWEGCSLASALRESPRWFAGVDVPRVVDAGLRPDDARAYRGLCQRAISGRSATDGFEAGDAKWLTRYRLDLAAVRPRMLMSVLQRVLRGDAERATSSDDGLWWGVPWGDGDDDVG